MATQNAAAHALNAVAAASEQTNLYGQERIFEDIDLTATTGSSTRLSSIPVRARFVKNGHSGVITPRQVVKWDTAAGETGNTVVPAGDGDQGCGVASPYIPAAGVPVNGGFWIIFDGPCQLISDGGSTLAVTDVVVTAASAKVNKQTAAPADTTAAMVQVNSVVGRPLESVTNVDGTTFRALVRFPLP